MPKAVFTFIRLFVLLLSFSIICLGALCVSSSSSCRCGKNELMFYCLLALGLFLLVAGIFWSTFHEVSKCGGLSSIVIQNPSHRALRISTVDRPDFYPPSYEDSTDPEKQSSVPLVDFTIKQEEIINIPPPPYSKSSAELISGTDEQEQPPPYELSVQWLQHQQTADQCSNLRRTESNFNPSTQENSYQQDTDCQGISERATPVRTSETGNA
ncbi:transmembrane protein 252 [Patagioenas fasciata]|uniref:transmembrane protein 252 n=1 Tax=Patagioenas fasciata TaxID=372321 RepID=UPI0032E89584